MTVSSTTTKVSYSGNGVTTVFTVPFYFLTQNDLLVILRASNGVETTQTIGTNYTVSGAGVATGGSITMTSAPASGTTVVILRNAAFTQGTDILPNDKLPAESLETALDKLTMLTQQLEEEVGRAVKFPASDSSALSAQLPASSVRAGKFLSFDSSGNPAVTTANPSPYSSADVTFIASGANAVLRSVQGKLRDTVSVKDFGAVGDGVTDDMDAFIAATNYLRTNGGSLYIPATTNGYYLRRGVGCNLGGANNIAIVSDGAVLKLQGGTDAQTGSIALFYSESSSGGVNNALISGLRFVSASTVIRYQNGGTDGATHFDPEVVAGRADANEVTSFRDVINFQGNSSNITVDNCYFGPGIMNGIQIKNTASGVISGCQFSNLAFDGVNQQCFYHSDVHNSSWVNITSVNKRGCQFDWTYYIDEDCENLTFTNTVIKHATYSANFGSGGAQVFGAGKDIAFSSLIIENVGTSAFVIGTDSLVDSARRITVSSFVTKTCGSSTTPVLNLGGNAADKATDVVIDGWVAEDCPWIVEGGGFSRLQISNFQFNNASRLALEVGPAGSVYLLGGVIRNCGSVTASGPAAISITNAATVRTATISNVDFIYDTYIPDYSVINVRGTVSDAQVTNCRFISNFGTCSVPAIYATQSGTIFVSGCSTSGYSANMTYSGATGAGVKPRIGQLPMTETTLTVDSATPSVADSILCVTANTTATSITNFTDGVQGQDIAVRVNDANTTFDFSSSSLKGNNGVDFAAASGDMVFCKKVGANWYCTIVEA